MNRPKKPTIAGVPIGKPEGIIEDMREARQYLAEVSEDALLTLDQCMAAESQRRRSMTVVRLHAELEQLLNYLNDEGEGNTLLYGEKFGFSLLDASETRSVIYDVLEIGGASDTAPEEDNKTSTEYMIRNKTPKQHKSMEEKSAILGHLKTRLGIKDRGANEIARLLTRIMKKIGTLKELDSAEYHEFIDSHAWTLKALITATTIGIELDKVPTKQRVTISRKGVKYEDVD